MLDTWNFQNGIVFLSLILVESNLFVIDKEL